MRVAILALLLTGPAFAQAVSPLNPPTVDTSQFDTPAQRNAAIAAATPSPCPAPQSDGLVATAGSQPTCAPRPDAQRATQVQSTTAITASDGTFAGNWPTPFAGTPVGQYADIPFTTGMPTPFKCAVTANAVSFSGKCWQLVTTTLPSLATSLLGLIVSPVANASAGNTVRIIGRQ